MRKTVLSILVLIIFLSACQNAAEDSSDWAITVSAQEKLLAYPDATQTAASMSHMEQELSEPTTDTRLAPEDWQKWPIVPEVTAAAKEIYRKGLAMGNNPKAFSKVADCHNLSTVFLWKFDHLDIYQFPYQLDEYLDTIENFQGYFDRDGFAAKFGFTAASPLTQLEADPEYCQPEETPLECEFRISKPSFVLISLEFPFLGRSTELYEKYLRKIIEFSVSQGVVPILATKADNVEGDHSINVAVAKLAYEYNLPLWNWWAAAQPLGDHGIDPYRDGFHLSEQAWEEHSKTFLMVLDHLWKGLKDIV